MKSIGESAAKTLSDFDDKERRLQVSLRGLLLLIAACGIWIAYFKTSSDVLTIQDELSRLRYLARELLIEDPSQLAAVQRGPMYKQQVWEVYVPKLDGKHFEIRLLMDDIVVTNTFKWNQISPLKQAVLAPGKHTIEHQYYSRSEQKNAVLKVLVDGETVIKETRPSDPGDSGRFIISSSVGSESKSFKNDEIVRLYHLRFRAISKDGSSSVPKNPRPGILLWIEAVDNAEEVAEKN